MTSIGNWSSNFAAATSRGREQGLDLLVAQSVLPVPVSLPRPWLATPAAHLIKAQRHGSAAAQRLRGDGEFSPPLGLRTVVRLGGHAHLAHRIAFDAESLIAQSGPDVAGREGLPGW